jgi:ubiquinone/menaquinone biosynthesis C-methylase UbiE
VQPYTPRFLSDQAQRTKPTRQYFYQQTKWSSAPLCLDIGCGAGVISPEIANEIAHSTVIGFDIDSDLLTKAMNEPSFNHAVHYVLADAMALPFRRGIADFALSHFTMMWIPDRIQALKEIQNILLPDGCLACIEPDYTGRIELHKISSHIQSKPPFPIVTALTRLGADPCTGSQLPSDLASLAFHDIQFGVLSWTFNAGSIRSEIKSEAKLLQEKGLDWTEPTFIYTPIFWVHALNPR